MKAKGKELDFISWIKRDGTGTVMCGSKWSGEIGTPKIDNVKHLNEDTFKLSVLSLTNETYIAHGFNSWVVKIKQ